MFSFHTSTNSLCIYDNTYYTCSSTNTSLILILIYNLYTVKISESYLLSYWIFVAWPLLYLTQYWVGELPSQLLLLSLLIMSIKPLSVLTAILFEVTAGLISCWLIVLYNGVNWWIREKVVVVQEKKIYIMVKKRCWC